MHVLHVAALENAAGGGVISALLALQKSFDSDTINIPTDKSRLRLSVLLPRASAGFPWIETLRTNGIGVYFATGNSGVVRTIVRLKPDIVHTHFVKWQVPTAIGALLCGVRLFFHLHSGAQISKASSLAARMKYAIMRYVVECFICVSSDISAYVSHHGVPAKRIVEIPNGVDLNYFRSPTTEEHRYARKELGIDNPSQPAVLFFGRDAVIKGADRLACALGALQSPVQLLCVASSKESIALLSQKGCVHDLGVVSDIRTVLWAADVLALPSRIEALPFAVLEARATGLPVVASELHGLQMFAEDPGTALIPFTEPTGNSVASNVQLETLARSLESASRRGRAALPISLANAISLSHWTERIRALYGNKKTAHRLVSTKYH